MVSAHGHLALWLWACGEAGHHGESIWLNKVSHLMGRSGVERLSGVEEGVEREKGRRVRVGYKKSGKRKKEGVWKKGIKGKVEAEGKGREERREKD